MKVAVDTRGATDLRGIGRYVRCLMGGLRDTAPAGDEIVERRRPLGADVFHSPWLDGVLLHPGRPQVLTLHDVVPLKRRREYLRTGARFRLRYLAAQRADRIIVPTDAVADDVVEHLGISRARLRVIHEAPDLALTPPSAAAVAEVRERLALPAEFLLWVGGMRHPDPRKRLPELLAAPRRLPLVLAGSPGPWIDALAGTAPEGHDGAAGGGAPLLVGEVDDADLAALYAAAHALVLPSDDEGFGLTPVEALACGCPVACSDVPALREVLGDRAAFAPRDDVAALVALAEGQERPAPAPPPWTWGDAGRATWDVYRELCPA